MRSLSCTLAVLSVSLATGCASKPPEAVPPVPASPAVCNAEPAQFAVGHAYGEAIAEEVRRKSGARSSRAIRPGQVVTMEYSPERVTMDLDAAGRVTRVRCG